MGARMSRADASCVRGTGNTGVAAVVGTSEPCRARVTEGAVCTVATEVADVCVDVREAGVDVVAATG